MRAGSAELTPLLPPGPGGYLGGLPLYPPRLSALPRRMAQINPPKPFSAHRTHNELREDQLQSAVAESSIFFEEHKTTIIAAIVGIAVLAAAILGWRVWQANKSVEGQQLLGSAIALYESGDYRSALDGTDTTPGLTEITDEFGGATGEQARFLAADAHFRLGEYDEALALFEDYDGDGLLEASALAGQAAVYEQKGDNARAGDLYRRAASSFASPASTPRYYLDAARTFAAAGDAEAAEAALQSVIDDYEDTPEAVTAQTEMGRVAAQASAVGTATGRVRPAAVPDTLSAAPTPALVPAQ